MKVMKNRWFWVGLVLCSSSPAWAAKDKDESTDSDTKDKASADSDSSGDEASKDDTADEEDEAPPEPKKKVVKAELKAGGASGGKSKVIDMALLGSLGASTFTRLGLGLRLGFDWDKRDSLYVGVVGTLFSGTSVNQERLTGTAQRTRSAIVLGGEVGYNVEASQDFLLRPYLSPGFTLVTDKTCATGACTSDNGLRLSIAPGVQAAYLLGAAYVGGDLRYQIIMNTADASAAVISITAGLRI